MTTGRVVRVSLIVDVLDVITNFTVALLTGSAVVFAEMAQGLADAMGSTLLVIGHRRSERPRDARHPFGYSREVFFWALLSALVMLVVGAGLSLWRGVSQLTRVEPLERPWLALGVVLLSTLTNGYAVSRSVARLRAEDPSLRRAYRTTSRQLVKTALLQDSLGTLSALIGLVAVLGYLLFGIVLFDAVGALVLAGLMVTLAGLLVSEARSLITGRAVPTGLRSRLVEATVEHPEVSGVNRLDAVFSGRRQILVDVDLDLADHLSTTEVEGVLDRIETSLRSVEPDIADVRVDLNSPASPPQRSEPR